MSRRGQALVEMSLFLSLFALMLWSLVSFSKWMLVREKLIVSVREAALLYSSGHVTLPETERRVRTALSRGWPRLEGSRLSVKISKDDHWANRFHLDIIRISYRPDSVMGQYFQQEMTEQCVIKHAPDYALPLTGPAIRWGSR